MHSTTFFTGAAVLLASTSLASDVSQTTTITRTISTSSISPPLNTGSGKSKSADANTFSIYDVYGFDGTVTPDVSIITTNPTATVYEVSCPRHTTGSVAAACSELTAPLTLTQGPSVLQFASLIKDSNTTATVDVSCKIDGTKAATCVIDEQTKNHTIFASTTVLKGTDMLTYIPAHVTGGAYRISNGTAVHATGSGVAKPTGLTTTASKTGPKPTTTQSTTSQPTNAASIQTPMIAGAGALVGVAMAFIAL